jgi:hypothetical protein
VTFHPVFSEFLSTFVSNRVRFLVVGAHALAVHGRPRYTDDLDVWVEPTPTNAKRVVQALKEFGYGSYALHEGEFATPDRMTHLGTPPLQIDVMTTISGLQFREAWSRRVPVRIDGMRIAFVGREDFIKNKTAAARAKDLADIALLEETAPSRSRRTSKNTPRRERGSQKAGKRRGRARPRG